MIRDAIRDPKRSDTNIKISMIGFCVQNIKRHEVCNKNIQRTVQNAFRNNNNNKNTKRNERERKTVKRLAFLIVIRCWQSRLQLYT